MDANAPFNLRPSVWGPHVWATLHATALKADASDGEASDAFRALLQSLRHLLPCETCRRDYSHWIDVHGMPKAGECFEYSVLVHNYVNQKLDKPTLSLSSARALWATTDEQCSYVCNNTERQLTFLTSRSAVFDFQTSVCLVLCAFAGYYVWSRWRRNSE